MPERALVIPVEVAAELRIELEIDLRAKVEELRIGAEDAERALEAHDHASLASRVRRFREVLDAIDARRKLNVIAGLPSQPLATCTIEGDAECSLAVELLIAHRETLVEHLADGYGPDRESVLEAVRRLTSYLCGLEATRLAEFIESPDGRDGC